MSSLDLLHTQNLSRESFVSEFKKLVQVNLAEKIANAHQSHSVMKGQVQTSYSIITSIQGSLDLSPEGMIPLEQSIRRLFSHNMGIPTARQAEEAIISLMAKILPLIDSLCTVYRDRRLIFASIEGIASVLMTQRLMTLADSAFQTLDLAIAKSHGIGSPDVVLVGSRAILSRSQLCETLQRLYDVCPVDFRKFVISTSWSPSSVVSTPSQEAEPGLTSTLGQEAEPDVTVEDDTQV
jgi:hypothetical protein